MVESDKKNKRENMPIMAWKYNIFRERSLYFIFIHILLIFFLDISQEVFIYLRKIQETTNHISGKV